MPKEQKEYLVEWAIELVADSPEAAAEEALRVHRDPESTATVFSVREFESGGDEIRIDVLPEGTKRL